MINNTKRLIEALQKSGYKVRYEKTAWGRGFRYRITGIGRANYKYSENAYKKGLTLVSPKRKYTMSESVLEQRRKARESKELLKQLSPEEKELYRKIRKLYKSKAHVKKFQIRHQGSTGKAPSIQQILKIHPARRLKALQRRRDELLGNANIDDMEGLASALEEAGRITGVDVYDQVAKLRSGDYDMTLEQFTEFSNILKDSNNPGYWRNQVRPESTISNVNDKLKALQRRFDELQGNANIDDMEGLASALEEAGRITGVDVYDLVAKLRSGDYTMSLEEFKEYSSILKDSNNANYWRKQVNPEKSINEVVDKLNAFFNKK